MQSKPAPQKGESTVISARLPKNLKKRVKTFCDENKMTMKDSLADAIIAKLELSHRERRRKSRL